MTVLQAAEDHENIVIDASMADERGEKVDYCDTDLEDARFDDCSFTGLQFARARLNHTTIRRTTFQGLEGGNAVFADASLTDVTVRASRVVGADFSSTTMKNVTFEDCNLTLASFRFARLTNVTFHGCNLSELDFQGVKATKVVFEKCRIERTEFSQATFQSGNIRMCEIISLSGVKFLSGIAIDEPALLALAPALAASVGLRLES